MIAPTHRSLLLAVLALSAAAAAFALTIGAPRAQAASYKSCLGSLSQSERYPPGGKPKYVLSLKQQKTSCSTAKRVMKAFHRCRSETGYRCTRKVLTRWTCSGRKDSSIPTQFNATFTCASGSRRVKSSYQQNT